MFRKYIIPFFALLGVAFSVFMIYRGTRKLPVHAIPFAPPSSPFKHYVAGEGLIESYEENIKIGVPFPDLITDVFVRAGDYVTKGTPLFKLDTRQLEADLCTALAQVSVAQTNYQDAERRFSFFQSLCSTTAVSKESFAQAYFAKQRAADVVKAAIAQAEQARVAIERSIICAPSDGEVLLQNARVGEFANVNPFDTEPLLVFGKTGCVQLRVNIAEEDAWRVVSRAPARAYVRGNSSIQIPLTYRYIEPYIVPKQSLTGSDRERVDTRVLQVVYEFDKNNYPVYVGQLLDVYIQAKPSITS